MPNATVSTPRPSPCGAVRRAVIWHPCSAPAAAFPDRCLLGAWLYGSRARGEERADSDIAVLSDSPLDPVALFDASSRLAARLGAAVDVVDLHRAGGLLRVEATHRGRAILPPTHEAE